MKILDVKQNTPEWIDFRRGKITGSKLKDLVVKRGTGKKDGFYELLAERLAVLDDGISSDRDRGHTLEEEALQLFEDTTGLIVEKDCGMWVSDDNDNIAISPDGAIKDDTGVYSEAIEVKSLSAKNHLRAIVENRIDAGFQLQVLQYFIVNEDLQVLHFVFYDPRVTAKPFHVIDFTREELEGDINLYKQYELDTLKEIDEWVEKLAF